MAVFDTTSATRGMARGDGRITSVFNRIAHTVIAWNDARVTRNALQRLTPHELDDIGLTPGDVDRLTWR